MAGRCYEKIPCDSCGSSDGKQVFQQKDDTFNATCFACGRFDPDPYKDREPGPPPAEVLPEDRARAVSRITDTMPIRAIADRGLRKEVCEYLGIRVGVAGNDGKTIIQHFYPSYNGEDLVGYEVRRCDPKNFYAIGSRGDIDFFGWRQAVKAGGRKLIITEDALSCASAIQAIRDYSARGKYADRWPSVVALPKGSGSAAAMIKRHIKELSNWDEIVLALDQDDPGGKAEDVIISMVAADIPVKVVRLPVKDPNDMVMGGLSEQLAVQLLFRARTKRYDGIKEVADALEAATKAPEFGLSWPWPTATELTFGIRVPEIHVIGAAPKIGKTDHQHQLAVHLANVHNEVVGLFDLENPAGKTLRKLAGKLAERPFHRPDVQLTHPGEIEEAAMRLDGKVKFYDSSNDRAWDAIKASIVAMNRLDGARFFFIDPLTALISMMESSSANDALNKIMTELTEISHKLQVTFFLYSHVNPPKTGKSHEEGGKVLSVQFTGSRAMEKWANYGWGIERNREAEDEDERNVATIRLLFDREYGMAGSFQVVYDPHKGTLLEQTYEHDKF